MVNIDFIFALLQTYVAFVAFATIVATLRQSFGTPLTHFQYILFRFFVETGLLHVILLLVPIMLFNLYGDEAKVWYLTTIFIVILCCVYYPSYVTRRRKVKNIQTPVLSKMVMIGYAISIVMNFLLIFDLTPFTPSMLTISVYFMWSMVAVILIFLSFLSTFIHFENGEE